MNIKYLKALKEAGVYPEGMMRGMPYLFEDIVDDPHTPQDEAGRCMPYNAYPMPSVPQLCELISDYSRMVLAAEISDMGTMAYEVKVWIGIQDAVETKFWSSFLDDALSETLIALKKNADEKESFRKGLALAAFEADPKNKYYNLLEDGTITLKEEYKKAYCLGEKNCTFPDNNHDQHPKG